MPEPSQNYANHTRFDPKLHFVMFPLTIFNFVGAAWALRNGVTFQAVWIVIMAAALVLLTFIVRVYPLRVQDRVIRLEERLRMRELLPEPLRSRAAELSPQQFVALRFASDEELAGLVQRTLAEKLEPKQIKEAIKNWRPDHFRV